MTVPCLLFLLLTLSVTSVHNERCPDKSTCPSEISTCCPSRTSHGFNCCPLEHAVCCEGGLYCCPMGTTCNSKNGTCDQEWKSLVIGHKWSQTQDMENNAINQVCPDKEHKCSSTGTCCRISAHEFGCCPYRDAICCSDNEHCCPSGTSCNMKEGTCDSLMIRLPAQHSNRTRVLCPGGKFECADGNTCCQLDTGYGCCPLEKAVCCSDKVHCCPHGFSCQDDGCQKQGTFQRFIPSVH